MIIECITLRWSTRNRCREAACFILRVCVKHRVMHYVRHQARQGVPARCLEMPEEKSNQFRKSRTEPWDWLWFHFFQADHVSLKNLLSQTSGEKFDGHT